jgi:hypothetical protein
MESIERRVAREAKEMTKRQVMLKAINGEITWLGAADILGVTARHMRRIRRAMEIEGSGSCAIGRGRGRFDASGSPWRQSGSCVG